MVRNGSLGLFTIGRALGGGAIALALAGGLAARGAYLSTFTTPFKDGGFENGTDWSYSSGASRVSGQEVGGSYAAVLPGGGTNCEMRDTLASPWNFRWNAPLEGDGVNARPGTLYEYSYQARLGAAGSVTLVHFLSSNGTHGYSQHEYQYSVLTNTSFQTVDVAGLRSRGGSAWDSSLSLRLYTSPAVDLFLDDFTGVTWYRPEMAVSDVSPIAFGTVTKDTQVDAPTRTVSNSQAAVASDRGTDRVSVLYGAAGLHDIGVPPEGWNLETDDVGAIIINDAAGVFCFVTSHPGDDNTEVRLVGADGNVGLLGGLTPESEDLTVRLLPVATAGAYTATLRLVTQAYYAGATLSTGQAGEPFSGLYYLDIPISAEVVPEPASLSLLALAGLAALKRRGRRAPAPVQPGQGGAE